MTALHHVNIVATPESVVAVAAFYAHVFGLTPVVKPAEGTGAGGAWLAIDARTQLHISERAHAGAHPDQHFALVVDDFAAVLDRIARTGAPWQEQADLFGGRRGWTRDPAGNRVEVCERAGSLA